MSEFWEKKRAERLALEAGYPVKLALAAEVDALSVRLAKAPTVLAATWAERDVLSQPKAWATYTRLVEVFGAALANLHRELPTTTLCVCITCRKVSLPGASGLTWFCCSNVWGHHPDRKARALPVGFWEASLPGELVKGNIEFWSDD